MSKFDSIKSAVIKTASRTGFVIKKHSPEILVVTGIIGVVGSAVMACKATTKINDILEKSKGDIDTIHDVIANKSFDETEYSKEDSKKDLAIVYVQTGVKLAKLYAPSIALGVLSITSILASNNILRKRNVALAAAYTAIDKGFKEYRSRVVERFGEEVDRELRYNIKAKKFEETIVDENGKEKKIKKTVDVVDPNLPSEYARFYDESCNAWEKDSEYNLMFLRAQQQYANDKLRTKGHLFLNEVYDELGIPRTKAGQVVGWIYDEKNPSGDNFVDFGIYETDREKARDFVNGYERVILLDFNVDGYILDKV